MQEEVPYPFGYAEKDAFFALPPEEKPPHIWEVLQYLEYRRGDGEVTDEQIDEQITIMRHIAREVAVAIARRLEAEEAYKNRFDPRWPRFRAGSTDPMYLTGCYPPLMLCLPKDEEVKKRYGFPLHDASNMLESAAWRHTPAGMHLLAPEDLACLTRCAEEYAQAVEETLQAEAEWKRSCEVVHKLMEEEAKRKG